MEIKKVEPLATRIQDIESGTLKNAKPKVYEFDVTNRLFVDSGMYSSAQHFREPSTR